MTLRRNTDDRLRELERRVVQGDLGAVLQLHQERKRAGQERERFMGRSHLVNVPGLGDMMLEPQDERTIMVKFGSEEGIGVGPDYTRQKVRIPPVVIRGVPYQCIGHYGWYEDEGFVPEGPIIPGRTYREDWMRTLERLDRGFPRAKATPTARAALLRVLTPFVNRWASENRRYMLEAEAGKANNAVMSMDKDVEKAIAELEEAQEKLAAALDREIRVQGVIKGLE